MLYLIYLCVFFFKQKTAYEMRISDWSSDVCSSDLYTMQQSLSSLPRQDDAPLTVRSNALQHPSSEQHLKAYQAAARKKPRQGPRATEGTRSELEFLNRNLDESGQENAMQTIGRASLRERVGPYVKFSEVAVRLKKTIKK